MINLFLDNIIHAFSKKGVYTRRFCLSLFWSFTFMSFVTVTEAQTRTISGTIYNDTDGSVNINGVASTISTGTNPLYVNLINPSGNIVYTATVNASGIFNIPTGFAAQGITYQLQLSKLSGVAGAIVPQRVLPPGWGYVGESKTGVTPYASDGLVDGYIEYTIGASNITDLRFGIGLAPALSNTTNYNRVSGIYQVPCGSAVANLNTLTASNTPSGSAITWHTGLVATAANRVTPVTNIAGTRNLYASFNNGTNYSPTTLVSIFASVCVADDDYSGTLVIQGIGATLPSIYTNDNYNAASVELTPSSVDFLYELWSTNIATVADDGKLIVSATAPAGTYTFYYKLVDNDPDAYGSNVSDLATVTIVISKPFSCDSKLYVSVNGSSAGTTQLSELTTASAITFAPNVGAASTPAYNATAFNPVDNFMYAISLATNQLLRIDADGNVTNIGAVTSLPVGSYLAGEIDVNGNYYVKQSANGSILYKINIITKTATIINLVNASNVAFSFISFDLAYYITNNKLYTVNPTNGDLFSIDLNTATLGRVTNVGGGNGSAVNYGAMFGSPTGIYGLGNSGLGLSKFDVTTGARATIYSTATLQGLDGVHCSTAPIVTPFCLQFGDFTAAGIPTQTGVSNLVGFANGWPNNVPNGFVAVESKNKGFVITRVSSASAIAVPEEGMLIYDEAANCIKLYNSSVWNCLQRSCN
ncbi:DUF6923 family protein [Flavobacterium qiangtangense]|uniref:DUF6923 family protein n=1 Tax=Flavobacterium qiangtangense TaxID=1442595 RepID=A0ABW1PMU7_9FLAO